MNKEYAKKIINKTIDDYNRIAEDWSTKRWRLSSDIQALAAKIEAHDNILDLGCGNGYLYNEVLSRNANYTGADTAEKQLEVCRRLHPDANFVQTDPLKLPFTNDEFDKVFCLSTIHHIPSKEFQLAFLSEIYRVLRKGGELYLTAWNLDRDKLIARQFDIDDESNLLYPFKDSSGTVLAQRFIHLFSIEELEKLLKEAQFHIEGSGIVQRGKGKFSNILTIAKKAWSLYTIIYDEHKSNTFSK